MMWLTDGEKKFDDMFGHFEIIPACDCDKQKNRRTYCDSI